VRDPVSIAAPANPGRLTHQLYRRALLKQIFDYSAVMTAQLLAPRPYAQDGRETSIALYA